jgi:pyrroline-5-carboxylate reductase
MGEALLAAIIGKRLSRPHSITVSDVSESRRRHLADLYGVHVTSDNVEALQKADVVVLAIKPQTLPEVIEELAGQLRPRQLLLSIIAGASINTLRRGLRHRRIVRSMPNTPARIGQGITIWTATGQVGTRQLSQIRSILGATGREIYVDRESYLDMATPLSGSGPAYLFYLVELLVESSVRTGLPRQTARELATQTMLGAAMLLQQSGEAPDALRRAVTSAGGTTAAALERLEKGNLPQLVGEAIAASYKRALELGK